jgi:hypothetical protein
MRLALLLLVAGCPARASDHPPLQTRTLPPNIHPQLPSELAKWLGAIEVHCAKPHAFQPEDFDDNLRIERLGCEHGSGVALVDRRGRATDIDFVLLVDNGKPLDVASDVISRYFGESPISPRYRDATTYEHAFTIGTSSARVETWSAGVRFELKGQPMTELLVVDGSLILENESL